jgi:hypothetical protein
MANYPLQSNPGLFVPTTNVWDVSSLYSIDINSPAFRELLVRLYQNLNNMSLALNLKDSGYYVLQEFLNGQAYFQNPALGSLTPTAPVLRQVFRLVVNFPGLALGVNTQLHGLTITTGYSFTRIYATASDTAGFNYYPIPFASAGGGANIEIRVDAINIIITNNSGVTFDKCYAVLEYIKS